MNTMFFIHKDQVPEDRWKEVTYGKIVHDLRPIKSEPNRTRSTMGGNRINYPKVVANMMMMNSVIYKEGAKFMIGDINNFISTLH